MKIAISILMFGFLLSGCITDNSPSLSDEVQPESEPVAAEAFSQDAWTTVVDRQASTTEFDVMCAMGGGISVVRSGEMIANQTSKLHVDLTVAATFTGYQVGHSIDGGAVTWLPVVAGGQQQNMTIEMPADFAETDGIYRWDFRIQASIPVAEPDCYTGGGNGEIILKILAHAG